MGVDFETCHFAHGSFETIAEDLGGAADENEFVFKIFSAFKAAAIPVFVGENVP